MHLFTGAIVESRAWPIFMFYFRTSPREKARFCEIRTLQVGDRPTKLAQAVAEVGRIDRTIHILTSIDDEFKRRRTLASSTAGRIGTAWHGPFFAANEVSYGRVIERDKRTSSAHWDL